MKILFSLLLFIVMLILPAKAETMILTKFDVGSRPYLILKLFVDKMNTFGNEKYIISIVPGANGEAAMNRAISLENRGNILLFGGPSNFVYSEIDNRNPEKYRSEFRQMKLISKTHTSIFVHRKTEIRTIEELIKKLRDRKEIYHASTERVNNPFLLNEIFVKTARLPLSKSLRYKTYGDMIKALEQNEADYGLMSLENETELVMLMNSSTNIKTPLSGLSLGFPDFVHELGLIFFTLKNELKYDLYLKDIDRVCLESQIEIKNLADKANYIVDCQESEKELNTRIKNDIDRIFRMKQ